MARRSGGLFLLLTAEQKEHLVAMAKESRRTLRDEASVQLARAVNEELHPVDEVDREAVVSYAALYLQAHQVAQANPEWTENSATLQAAARRLFEESLTLGMAEWRQGQVTREDNLRRSRERRS